MTAAMLSGFRDEFVEITKEAGWGKNLLLAGGMAAGLGGAAKMAPKVIGAAKPAMAQAGALAKAPLPQAARLPVMGGKSSQFAERGMQGIMP
jgi:hypothetical protein